ncbi:protein-methionine-sulfoxide reductase catalytic subunit MsrP [Alginatibacterium sediminis]|uniref:Protein-methionine-sulfoxide reductase catalytic subunit MsrP n=1 Tax=Alginatibacterium sediminis TaxID=2164068 RepID=A0A420E910_9ALTE|nr:protein-methionine-sulfoxide reductase catalytic subunit MsrP [Alginatibacterium sediminis]RKF15774.1 protein-methionine-sulfoxide reductase catalytic subunit MsrP [Alginatibacterium sediminis]
MWIRSKPSWDYLSENDVTPEAIFKQRRLIMKGLVAGGAGLGTLGLPSTANAAWFSSDEPTQKVMPLKFKPHGNPPSDSLTPESKATTHNNFYEFGTGKNDPANNSSHFQPLPWQLKVDGLVENEVTIDVEKILAMAAFEERIYRLRCVEAWSMVIPWVGLTLKQLLKDVKPLSGAKYLAFETLYDPEQFPGQENRRLGGGIDYPYREGLRLDEAYNDLTFMAFGMYGKTLPAQNGAPLRLVVPWKYGFKSIKSISRITFTDQMPQTTWNMLGPSEYGFYANVNPGVDHPRWTQKTERRIDDAGILGRTRIDTLMFNGYSEQVASMYKDLDLTRYY